MGMNDTGFELRFATSEADLRLAQNLRYDVFVDELGAGGAFVDHAARLERDAFDPVFEHLMLLDHARKGNPCVGVYRLMRAEQAHAAGQFYCDDEYDLTPLKTSGRKLLELGRSCLHPDYRGGTAMMHLWSGLVDYVDQHEIEILFGVASFHGTDPAPLSGALSFLHHRHLAPEPLRVRAREAEYQPMNLIAPEDLDRAAASRAIPALIKAYLRMGGYVGEGAFIDKVFNTTDVCLVMDVLNVSAKHLALYRQAAMA